MRSKLIIVNIILLLVLVSQSYGWALPPVAVLEADPEYVADGCSVTLDGSGSYDPDSSIIKYEWDFTNDGTYDYNETSVSPGDGSFDGNTTHTYNNPGKYTAKLRVTDAGATDTNTCTVYVGIPVAVLDANPQYVADGCSVTLEGSDSYDSDGTIVKYEWDFTNDGTYDYNEISGSAGDGSFDGNTTHTYSNPGKYTAKLRVTDDDSATDTDTCIVYVSGTYYVDPDGNDANDGLSWANAFATIQKGIDSATGGNPSDANHYDVIDVNSGTYVTEPIYLNNSYQRFVFEPDVTVKAHSIFDANYPQDSGEPNSFRNFYVNLFRGIDVNGITFDGDNTVFQLRRDEYPVTGWFDANTNVNCDTNEITIENHGYRVGDHLRYYYPVDGNSIGGLVKWQVYCMIIEDVNTVKLASSFANAEAGIEINLTSKPNYSEDQALSGGEFRHIIALWRCDDVNINNLTCKDAWGDGIYVGRESGYEGYASNNVLISNVTIDNNRRNGISISGVNDLTVEGCIIKNTIGTNPQAGIDIEAHAPNEVFKNITIRDCVIEGNENYGIVMTCNLLEDDPNKSDDISITVQDVYIRGVNTDYSILVRELYDTGRDGSIDFENVTVESTGLTAVGKYSGKVDLSFTNCVWINIDENASQVVAMSGFNDMNYPGGIDFNNCQIFDDVNRPAIKYFWPTGDTLTDITGTLYVKNDNRSGPLYEWDCADTNNVTINVNAGVVDFVKAYNKTQYKWYSSIQGAIDDANSGDVIDVAPTTHYETIDFNDKSVTLQSFDPYDWDVVEATIIDGNGSGSAVVTFSDGEDGNSVLSGITLTGGEYGVSCSNSSSPVITNCVIEDNNSHGINCTSGAPEITYNKIRLNGGDGINSSATSPPTIKNNWVYDNSGDGMQFGSATSAGVVRNDTIVDNTGYGIYVDSNTAPTISNCILWDNGSNDLESCSATYSCIEDGDAGTGNISSDPCFVNIDANDFHLDANSLCIEAGDPNSSYSGEEDIDGDGRVIDGDSDSNDVVDIGADEYDPNS